MPSPILVLNSQTHYVADGSTTTWNFNFAGGYISKDHVKAYKVLPGSDLVTPIPLLDADIGEAQVSIIPAITDGASVVIYRDTPKDMPLVDYTNGQGYDEASLDTTAKQAVFIAAEVLDRAGQALNVGGGVAELQEVLLAAPGAGLVGFIPGTVYPANTVGAALTEAIPSNAVDKDTVTEQVMNGDLTIQQDSARIRLQRDTDPLKTFSIEISSTKAQLYAQGGIATEVVGDLTVTGLLAASPESMPGRLLGIQRFTTVGTFTYTPTPGTAFAIVEMYGGGGSGSGAPATGAGQCSFGGPGGAGGYGKFRVAVDFLSATVDIGAGGVAGPAGAAGTDGGTTKITVVPGTRYFQASGGQRGLPASPYGIYPWASYQGGFYGQGAWVSSTPGDIMLINSGPMKADNSLALAVGMLIVGAGGTPFGFPPGGLEYTGSGPGIASYIPLCGSGGRGYGNGPSGAARLGDAGNQGSMTIYEYSGTN